MNEAFLGATIGFCLGLHLLLLVAALAGWGRRRV